MSGRAGAPPPVAEATSDRQEACWSCCSGDAGRDQASSQSPDEESQEQHGEDRQYEWQDDGPQDEGKPPVQMGDDREVRAEVAGLEGRRVVTIQVPLTV
jgi:hypothetical protein